ncbi:MAG TPA: PaaI family thioesterase [Candidatus Binataceae bacterium]|nr:PaaI family thioesterase [Candidatus Binataceae bacterium]
MSERSQRLSLDDINRLIKQNRVNDYLSPNLALGMRPLAFGVGTSQWLWDHQPPAALNPFGTIQGGYITVLIDEMLSTAIASVLEEGEWAMTAEFKVSFMRALTPGPWNGEACVRRRTRALAFLEAQITDQAGTVVVTATSTWAIARR